MNNVILRIAEAAQRHIGKGIAVVDPKIVEDNNWEAGNILELTGNRKSHTKLWPGSIEEYGAGTIKVDGITRQNIGSGIGEKISVKKVDAKEAEQVTVSPTEKLRAEGLQEYMQANYIGHVLTTGDTFIVTTQLGGKTQLVVTNTVPSGKPVIVTAQTSFKLGSVIKPTDNSVPRITYDDLGGLKNEVQKIREMVELPMRHPELFEKLGVEAPKGVLLYGPPGTGKTLIAKAVAHTTESNFISIKGPELLSKWVGESEKGVREVFRKARQAAPCIIFLDEIDSLAPSRSSGSSDSHVTERIVSQLLTEIDGLEELHNVLVIGATNRVDLIDNALLRPGRFDRILEVPLQDSKGRQNIFQIHTKKKPLENNVDFARLVELTSGFSGAEIEGVCNRAAMSAIRRYVDSKEKSVKSIKITQEDFENAIKKLRPDKVTPRQAITS